MDIQELTDFIIKKISSLGIDYRPYNYDNQIAWVDCYLKIGGYNPDTATPFNHAHEYIHAFYKDDTRLCEYDKHSPAEQRANKESIILLWELFISNGGNDNDVALFCDLSGCPYDDTFSVLKKINRYNDFDNLTDCARDYITYFDVIMPDTINIYNFLDCYGLPYTDYRVARDTFNRVCGFELAV